MTTLASRAVDRSTDTWQRIRAACHWAADYVDLDHHADAIWLTVQAFRNAAAPAGSNHAPVHGEETR